MEDWLRALLGLVANPIKDIVAAVEARLSSIWSTASGFWVRVRGGWVIFRFSAGAWIRAQLDHAQAVALTLQWFATVYVPRLIAQSVDRIWTSVTILFSQAVQAARGELIQVRDWLAGLVATVTSNLRDWSAWVYAKVGELRSDVDALLGRVFGPLATPQRLADWIVEAMVDALARWLRDNAVALGRRLIAERTRIALTSIHWIEDVISRII